MKPIKFLRYNRAAASVALLALAGLFLISAAPAIAAVSLNGQVLGAGAPISDSTVTLYAASAGAPKQLGQAKTGADGRFTLTADGPPGKDAMLYLVAKGGTPAANKAGGNNPAIALLWFIDHLFVLVLNQSIVAQHLATFQQFPPRQRPGSFSIDKAMEN